MKDRAVFRPLGTALLALLLWANALPGQGSHSINITPEKATLLIGESKTFRLVDQNGQMQRNVSWLISDSDAFQSQEGDELVVTAKRAGDFTISAHTPDGSGEATIKVMEGDTLPQGTAKWTGVSIPGCKSTRVTPAVPSASGIDIFEQSSCEDGEYITAYTSEGIQVWRRKIGGVDQPTLPPIRRNETPVSRPTLGQLNLQSTSICDSVVAGTPQQKIRELLDQHKLSYREGAAGEQAWTVDESSTECKLWFDGKLILTKKRKTFVSE
jgi:hypothetical protein